MTLLEFESPLCGPHPLISLSIAHKVAAPFGDEWGSQGSIH